MRISVGIDVAKAVHWACVVDDECKVVLNHAIENTPVGIDAFVANLRAIEGDPLIGLDVVGSFASFLEATLLAEGFRLVHAPGIAVNRAGQGFAGGERKSDPRDARTIAELVRTRDLRPISPDGETVVALRLKIGRRRDLVEEQTRRLARLRMLLCRIHPQLERTIDVTCKGPLVLISRYVTPAEIRRAGKRCIMTYLAKERYLQGAEALVDGAIESARAQSMAIPGEAAVAELIRELAAEALDTRSKLARIEADIRRLLDDHPDGALIRSLPGMGVALTAELIACIGNIERFPSADALASAAGLAPVIRQSGYKKGWRRTFGGDKQLKRVFYQSAFCAVSTGDPISRAFYDRKRREGKYHTQALIALARRRVTVLWTMLQRREAFDPVRKAA